MSVAQLAVVALLAQGPAIPQSPAIVEGTVVRSGTGQPVSGARVQLFRVGRRALPGLLAGPDRPTLDLDELKPYSAMTAQDGRFIFDNVKPGEYRLVALRSGGYVPASSVNAPPPVSGSASSSRPASRCGASSLS